MDPFIVEDVVQTDKEVFGKIQELEEHSKKMYLDTLSDDYEAKYEDCINQNDNFNEGATRTQPDKRAISVLANLGTHSDQLKKAIARNIVRTMQMREQRKSPDIRLRSITDDHKQSVLHDTQNTSVVSKSRERPTHEHMARERMQEGRNIITLFNTQRANKTLHGYKPYKSYSGSRQNQFSSFSSDTRLRELADFPKSGKMYPTELVAHCGKQVRLVRRVKL